jgi:Patatin-like phospholipase
MRYWTDTVKDGGGVRGFSMLVILESLMHRSFVEVNGRPPRPDEKPKPSDYFDLIAGTGTGGLIAIMLGRLRLDLETSKNVYVRMTRKVFETDKTIAGIPYKHTLFKASKLEEAIRECVREHTVYEDEGNDGTATGGHEFQSMSPISAVSAPQRTASLRSTSSFAPNSPASLRSSIHGIRWGNPNASLYDGRENRTKT